MDERTDRNPLRRPPRGRVVVVSGFGRDPMTPRGQRTRRLVECLERSLQVELVALPAATFAGGATPARGRPLWRRALGGVMHSFFLDRWEVWSLRRFAGWRPEADAALLIATPWSPVARAARVLRRRGIPYVVDVGDTWALTTQFGMRPTPARFRSRRAERDIWGGAVGAVVTTRQQRDALRQLFPELPIAVRPNGFDPVKRPPPTARSTRERDVLHLAHFGQLLAARLDIAPFLRGLADNGDWRLIRFAQFGDDHEGMLAQVPDGVEVDWNAARPWPEIVARAGKFDAVVVLGNRVGDLLPSKAIQYLTLPVPRIAVTDCARDDALADFAAAHSGWLATSPTGPEVAPKVRDHVRRSWSPEELEPPASEAWPVVVGQVCDFFARCIAGTEATAVAVDEHCLDLRGGQPE